MGKQNTRKKPSLEQSNGCLNGWTAEFMIPRQSPIISDFTKNIFSPIMQLFQLHGNLQLIEQTYKPPPQWDPLGQTQELGWSVQFMLKIDLEFLLRKNIGKIKLKD